MRLFPQINRSAASAAMTDEEEETPSGFRFASSGCSEAGPCREVNEDHLLDAGEHGLWAVADGMGGHRDGGRAARSSLDAIANAAKTQDSIPQALKTVNAALYAEGLSLGTIGATIAVLQIKKDKYQCIWAGDCRIYRLRDQTLSALTHDHSEVNQLIRSGLISLEEAATHPLRNIVTRAIGAHENIELEVSEGTVQPKDIFFLCTDGLTNTLSENHIISLRANARDLVLKAVSKGAKDNVTALSVAIS
ncbi:PP2C family protein-serine/threonine phosphatase [Hyphococcus sp.]|uniref:PP2C family protein-serine/threonine phosphatase n=1 Tax=Hyphococcus sp. TaxID=2038636 RepID=UPI003CCBE12F